MNPSDFAPVLLSTLRRVVPLLYLGQIRELFLILHPRTSSERERGPKSLAAWRKRCRGIVREILDRELQKATLGTFVKDGGYFHKGIVQNEPLLSLNPGESPADIRSVQLRMKQFFSEERTDDRSITAYYALPSSNSAYATIENAFFEQTLSLVSKRKTDSSHPVPIKAFRVGSLYVSQLAYNRADAKTFHLVDKPYTLDPDEDFVPRATIERGGFPTDLFISTKDLSDRLEEFLALQQGSGKRIEIW